MATDEIETKRVSAIENRRRVDEEAKLSAEREEQAKIEAEAMASAEVASIVKDDSKKAARLAKVVAAPPTPPSDPVHEKGRRTNKPSGDEDPIKRVK
jgi:membrane protein involved in colicin uptake